MPSATTHKLINNTHIERHAVGPQRQQHSEQQQHGADAAQSDASGAFARQPSAAAAAAGAAEPTAPYIADTSASAAAAVTDSWAPGRGESAPGQSRGAWCSSCFLLLHQAAIGTCSRGQALRVCRGCYCSVQPDCMKKGPDWALLVAKNLPDRENANSIAVPCRELRWL